MAVTAGGSWGFCQLPSGFCWVLRKSRPRSMTGCVVAGESACVRVESRRMMTHEETILMKTPWQHASRLRGRFDNFRSIGSRPCRFAEDMGETPMLRVVSKPPLMIVDARKEDLVQTDFERLGVFYLGKTYDLANKRATDELVLYDSKDLVTHAVCVGMT